MYSIDVQDSPIITVSGGKHEISYAVNGSLMNPLEAFYAALAGCAAVYAKKACKELGISAEGIHIDSQPFAGSRGPLTLGKFRTEVSFPDALTQDQRSKVLDAIKHCAVKEIVVTGANIDFSVSEKRALREALAVSA